MAMPRCLPFHPGQGVLTCQDLFDDSDKEKVAYLTYANLCFLLKHMIFVQAVFR